MKLTIDGLTDGGWIDARFAFGVHDPDSHVRLSANRNPALSWSGVPGETRSLVLVCVDRSVPSRPDDVNKEGREVPADLRRVNFYHWVMVDIPVSCPGTPVHDTAGFRLSDRRTCCAGSCTPNAKRGGIVPPSSMPSIVIFICSPGRRYLRHANSSHNAARGQP
jgi:phosphatidylethanolamine-binding protein (PEBP) family uncharacterized protein